MMKELIYKTIKGNEGRCAVLYNTFMFVVVIASLLPLMMMHFHPWFIEVDIVTTLIFVIDYLARWYICDMPKKRGKRSPFVYYPFTPMAIIDMLSILPALIFINPAFKVLRTIRLLKLFNVFKILRISKSITLFATILKRERHILLSVMLIALIYIFITALIMFNVEPRVNPVTGQPTFTSFFDAIYWATVTLTTVGYGDLCPATDIGRCISMLSSFFGVAVIALPSGVITASYLEELRKARARKEKH